ncbi:hypothetical protein HK405_003008 [Cladochytrium tenue]|nr:hypothetical protein HK405_003008 [Cladochytrium tenue]
MSAVFDSYVSGLTEMQKACVDQWFKWYPGRWSGSRSKPSPDSWERRLRAWEVALMGFVRDAEPGSQLYGIKWDILATIVKAGADLKVTPSDSDHAVENSELVDSKVTSEGHVNGKGVSGQEEMEVDEVDGDKDLSESDEITRPVSQGKKRRARDIEDDQEAATERRSSRKRQQRSTYKESSYNESGSEDEISKKETSRAVEQENDEDYDDNSHDRHTLRPRQAPSRTSARKASAVPEVDGGRRAAAQQAAAAITAIVSASTTTSESRHDSAENGGTAVSGKGRKRGGPSAAASAQAAAAREEQEAAAEVEPLIQFAARGFSGLSTELRVRILAAIVDDLAAHGAVVKEAVDASIERMNEIRKEVRELTNEVKEMEARRSELEEREKERVAVEKEHEASEAAKTAAAEADHRDDHRDSDILYVLLGLIESIAPAPLTPLALRFNINVAQSVGVQPKDQETSRGN